MGRLTLFPHTRVSLARFFVLLAIRLIPMDTHGATFGAVSRLWQANDRLKARIADFRRTALGASDE